MGWLRLASCFALAVFLIPMLDLDVHAGPDPERAPVSALIDELSSKDVAVRRAVAKRIVDAGYFAIKRVALHAASLDAEAWQAFADAIIKDRKAYPYGPSHAVRALVWAAHTAPEAHRRRLIALARRLNPEAGRTPTPKEIEALVRRELVEKRGRVDDDPGGAVVIFGHAGMATALRLVREGDPDIVDRDRAGALMASIAQPEDVPALRELLLEGKTFAATALGRLDALGFTKALDALIEAVDSGIFDGKVAVALRRTSNRRRAARAVREWMHRHGREKDRVRVANVFAALESRADIPIVEEWSASARDERTLLALGRALTKLGSVKGIDLLVRIVGEKKVDPPPRRGPKDSGRLSAGGFGHYERWVALESLNAVVVQLSDPAEDEQGPWKGPGYGDLDQVVPDVRAWWEATRDRIQFDEKAGEWRLKSD